VNAASVLDSVDHNYLCLPFSTRALNMIFPVQLQTGTKYKYPAPYVCSFSLFQDGDTRIAQNTIAQKDVDWGSRFVGEVNWGSVVGTGLSGPTLSVL
jgi:hypothetical protein